jgi:molecular chaperone HscA
MQPTATVVVGQRARALALAAPQDTIASVKRFMGRGPGDAEATRELTSYRFAPSEPAIPSFVLPWLAGHAR